jgi:hypothetical protein
MTIIKFIENIPRGRRGHDRMVVGSITTNAIIAYHR